MRKLLILSGLALVGLALIVSTFNIWGNHSYAAVPTAAEIAYPGPTVIPAQSRPAPDPFEAAANRPVSAPGISAITPPVTEARVREYIANSPSAGGIVAQNVQVTNVRFLTLAELRPILGNRGYPKSLSPDAPLVYATIGGDFTTENPDGIRSTQSLAYRVFSAVTGNELFGGTLLGP